MTNAASIPDLETRNGRRVEFLIALILIAVMSAAFLERATRLAETNQQLAAEQWVRTINTLLAQVLVRHALDGRLNELGPLADSNPMAVLQAHSGVLPGSYIGEVRNAGLRTLPPGAWAFDTDTRELVHRLPGRERALRWRMRPVFAGRGQRADVDPGVGRVTGLYLERAPASGP